MEETEAKKKVTIKDIPEEYREALSRDTKYDSISVCWPESYWVLLPGKDGKGLIFYHNTFNGFWKVHLHNGDILGSMGVTAKLERSEEDKLYTFIASFQKWELVEKTTGFFSKKKYFAMEQTMIEKSALLIPKREIKYISYQSEWAIPGYDPVIPEQ